MSHASAVGLWGLGRDAAAPVERDAATPVEVSVEGRHLAPGPAVLVHRVTRLDPADRGVVRGVPVTSVARTVLDMAPRQSDRRLEQLLALAERKGLARVDDLAEAIARHPRAPGARRVREILGREAPPAFTRSEAEERFLALVRRARLQRPRINTVLQGLEVDFLWPDARLAVEVDGAAYHSGRRAFERDRRRDATLAALGYRVMRVTWRQLHDEPEALLVRLTRALTSPDPLD